MAQRRPDAEDVQVVGAHIISAFKEESSSRNTILTNCIVTKVTEITQDTFIICAVNIFYGEKDIDDRFCTGTGDGR